MIRLLTIMALVIPVVGCGANASYIYLNDVEYTPRPESHSIEIMEGNATRPHVLVAQVHASDMAGFSEGTSEDCIREIKGQARELGGDAIVRFKIEKAASGSMYASGDLVRWK